MTDLLGAADGAAQMRVDVESSGADRSATDVLREAADRGIRHALLRAPATANSDVDVLVHPRDRKLLASCLRQRGFFATPSARHWPHQFFAKWDACGWVVFDVLDRVTMRDAWLGGRRLAAELVDRSNPDDDGVRRLDPDDQAWAAWLHAALRGDRSDVPTAPVDRPSPLARAVHDAKPPLSARAQRVLGRWRDRSPHRFARRKGRVGGCTVALMGPDGAGKSTLAAGLQESLPLPVHLIYMGVFRTNERQLAWRRIPGAGLLIRLCQLWWRATRARYHRSRGHVVVFDRYVYDATLRPGPRGPRARLSYWLLERSCPPPDVLLLLDAPGAVMFARKKEHDAALLEERRAHYLALAARLPQASVIDATMGREQVVSAAITHIWKALTTA